MPEFPKENEEDNESNEAHDGFNLFLLAHQLLAAIWATVCRLARDGMSAVGASVEFLVKNVLNGCSSYMSPINNVGEGNGTPLQYSCLENPMDGGAW